MFVSKCVVMQFVNHEDGQRSEPFTIDPNKFEERIGGFNATMREETLVLVLADVQIDPTSGPTMCGVSRFPIVSAAFFNELAKSETIHRAFSDDVDIKIR